MPPRWPCFPKAVSLSAGAEGGGKYMGARVYPFWACPVGFRRLGTMRWLSSAGHLGSLLRMRRQGDRASNAPRAVRESAKDRKEEESGGPAGSFRRAKRALARGAREKNGRRARNDAIQIFCALRFWRKPAPENRKGGRARREAQTRNCTRRGRRCKCLMGRWPS